MSSKLIPTKPLLILLYGFPGSGKTYFSRQLCENLQAAHVQGDRIRSELFEQPSYDKKEDAVVAQLANYITGEFLNSGVSVVYDINAARGRQRHDLRELARKAHAQTILIWLQIDVESAFTRSVKRDRRKADDKYAATVDRSSFDDIIGSMQNPKAIEDYVVISGKHVFKTQFSAVTKRLRELGLVDLSDIKGHVAKPGMVNLVPNSTGGRVDMSRRNIVIR
jgi:predicted kinase